MDSRKKFYVFKNNSKKGNTTDWTILSTSELSIFILHHKQNGICNKNIFSIQEIMRVIKLTNKKFKRVCGDFTDLAILIKSDTPGEVQLKFVLVSVEKKSLG